MDKIKVHVTNHYRLVREAWRQLFETYEGFQVIGEAGNSGEVIDLTGRQSPDVILLDLHLQPTDWINTIRSLRLISPRSGVIGISTNHSEILVRNLLSTGARGFLTRNSGTDELVQAVMEVHKGQKYICREVGTIFDHDWSILQGLKTSEQVLTRREREVVRLVIKGFTSKDIASRCFISEKTVEAHRYNILSKLKLRNRASLVNYADTHGIL